MVVPLWPVYTVLSFHYCDEITTHRNKNSTEKEDINRNDRGCCAFNHEHHCLQEYQCCVPQHQLQLCHLGQEEKDGEQQQPRPTFSTPSFEQKEKKTYENSPSMQGSVASVPKDQEKWRQVVYIKEKELQEIREYHVQDLERKLVQQKSENKELQDCFDKLREDFKYNLRLIDCRDAELERYESMLEHAKACFKYKEAEVGELSKYVDDLLNRELDIQSRECTAIIHWQAKCKDLRNAMDRLKWSKEDALREARKEASKAKAQLSKRVLEAEDALEASRRELTASFEEIIGQRELESKSRESIIQSEINTIREHAADEERKVNMLQAEALALRNEIASLRRDLSSAQKETRVALRKIDSLEEVKAEEICKLQEEREHLVKEGMIAHDVGERRVGEVIDLLKVAERALEDQKKHFESTILRQQRSALKREDTLQIEIEALRETTRKYEGREAKHCAELKQSQDQLCKLESDIALERTAVGVARAEAKTVQEKLKSAEEEVKLNRALLDDARVKAETMEADAEHVRMDFNSTQQESSAKMLALEGSLRGARDRVDEVEKRFREAEENFKLRTLAHVKEKEELTRHMSYLE